MAALTGFRVVELAGSVAGEYCGKLLADFGAEVIKVETPGWGSPTRAMAPVFGDGAGREGSALFAYLNTNKHSVEVDVTSAAGALRLHELVGTADAVIDDRAVSWADRLDHPFWPGGRRGVRKCQEHQRVPRKRLGVSHSQPC
jgi:crotonobetainyl-CoA:carnitine CoA-transferase CaiB-like acyl-CoA transferase